MSMQPLSVKDKIAIDYGYGPKRFNFEEYKGPIWDAKDAMNQIDKVKKLYPEFNYKDAPNLGKDSGLPQKRNHLVSIYVKKPEDKERIEREYGVNHPMALATSENRIKSYLKERTIILSNLVLEAQAEIAEAQKDGDKEREKIAHEGENDAIVALGRCYYVAQKEIEALRSKNNFCKIITAVAAIGLGVLVAGMTAANQYYK